MANSKTELQASAAPAAAEEPIDELSNVENPLPIQELDREQMKQLQEKLDSVFLAQDLVVEQAICNIKAHQLDIESKLNKFATATLHNASFFNHTRELSQNDQSQSKIVKEIAEFMPSL